jgi:hypothetical protein
VPVLLLYINIHCIYFNVVSVKMSQNLVLKLFLLSFVFFQCVKPLNITSLDEQVSVRIECRGVSQDPQASYSKTVGFTLLESLKIVVNVDLGYKTQTGNIFVAYQKMYYNHVCSNHGVSHNYYQIDSQGSHDNFELYLSDDYYGDFNNYLISFGVFCDFNDHSYYNFNITLSKYPDTVPNKRVTKSLSSETCLYTKTQLDHLELRPIALCYSSSVDNLLVSNELSSC